MGSGLSPDYPVCNDIEAIGIVTHVHFWTHVTILTGLVHWKQWTQTAPEICILSHVFSPY